MYKIHVNKYADSNFYILDSFFQNIIKDSIFVNFCFVVF